MFSVAHASGVWDFRPHPEIWVLCLSLVGFYTYAVRVVGPKVVAPGDQVVTRNQLACAVAALLTLWIAADWPMHDVGEQYLYSIHMVQHTLLTLVVPPLALFGSPRWLADLVLGDGKVRAAIRWLARPVTAAVLYNAAIIAGHWPALVNSSARIGPLHFLVHLMFVFTAILVWMPICGPIREWRMGKPATMIYLFLMSVIPTIPGGWLTFADRAVYSAYDTPTRAFGITVQNDQQMAGVFMKLGAGGMLWVIITFLFFKWAQEHSREQKAVDAAHRRAYDAKTRRLSTDTDPKLVFDQVSEGFVDSRLGGEAQKRPGI